MGHPLILNPAPLLFLPVPPNLPSSEQHLIKQGKETAHVCGKCNKSFQCHAKLLRHGTVHTHEKLYECTVCHKKYPQTSTVIKHQKDSNYADYILQKKLRDAKSSYECPEPECGKSFLHKQKLLDHKNIHTGDKPYVCPKEGCFSSYPTKSSRAHHIKK